MTGLHYACKDSPNICTIKEFLKECFKKMTELNYKELITTLNNFKTEIKGENFDPSISSKIHVLQSHNHATHSVKT